MMEYLPIPLLLCAGLFNVLLLLIFLHLRHAIISKALKRIPAGMLRTITSSVALCFTGSALAVNSFIIHIASLV